MQAQHRSLRRSCHGRITVGKSRGQFGIQPRILHNGTLAYRGLPQSGVDGKSRMGFAADRLINAQYQISGTVIGKLDPVKHHDAIHRVELRQRIERRHGRAARPR